MNLRQQLVSIALEWQQRFGVAPAITSALSEYDGAMLIGCSEENYSLYMQERRPLQKVPTLFTKARGVKLRLIAQAENPEAR